MSAKKICIEKDQHILDHGEEDKKKAVINSLNYDVLAQIIMSLPIADRIDMEEVCVKWKEACKLAWYDIKKYKCKTSIGRSYDNRLLTQSYLKKILLRCGKYLNELSLSDVCHSSIMPFLGVHCRNLTSLECKFRVSFLKFNADDFVQAFTQLDRLKCIRITTIYDVFYDETFNPFGMIDSLPENINEIHIIVDPLPHLIDKVSINFKKFIDLQKLTLDGCTTLDNKSLREMAGKTSLVYLNIPLYRISGDLEFSLFDKLVNLEYVDLTPILYHTYLWIERNYFSTNELHAIFRTCKKLKHLDLTSDAFYKIAEIPSKEWINFQNLEYLGFSCNIMPDLANAMVKYCKNLKHLRINHHQRRINDTALQKLTELEYLETLVLLSSTELSATSVVAISNNCKKLKHLEIPSLAIELSVTIDDEPLTFQSVLDEFSKLRYLEHLNLWDAHNLTDSTIFAIANNCNNLKHLDIRNYRSITEMALIALTNLKNLQKLYVTGLNMTERVIIKLNGLKELSCSFRQEFTNADIIQLIKNNPDLEHLNLREVGNDDFVKAADQATKNRTNGIILRLKISALSRSTSFIRPKIESQWLIVSYT